MRSNFSSTSSANTVRPDQKSDKFVQVKEPATAPLPQGQPLPQRTRSVSNPRGFDSKKYSLSDETTAPAEALAAELPSASEPSPLGSSMAQTPPSLGQALEPLPTENNHASPLNERQHSTSSWTPSDAAQDIRHLHQPRWLVADAGAGLPPVEMATASASATGMVSMGMTGLLGAGIGIAALAGGGSHGNSSPESDTTAPWLQSAEASSQSNTITLVFDSPLDAQHKPDLLAFRVQQNGQTLVIDAVEIASSTLQSSGNTVVLRLSANTPLQGQTALSVSYNDNSQQDNASAIQDVAGNDARGFTRGIVVDAADFAGPVLTLTMAPDTVLAGASATLSLDFSVPIQALDTRLISTAQGTLSQWVRVSSQRYTATFTPDTALETQALVNVPGAAYQDSLGRYGLDMPVSFAVDTLAPSVSMSSSHTTLIAGQTAQITFNFSEGVQGFGLDDLQVTGGALSQLQTLNAGHSYSATLTPDSNLPNTSSVSLSLLGGGISDTLGNPNAASTPLSVPIDKVRPLLSAITGTASSDTITLTFDVVLDSAHLPDASQFTVTQAGQTLAVRSLSLSAPKVLTLQLASDLSANPFSLRYQDASSGDDTQGIQSASGNDSLSFQQGLVADGPIKGARIYIDANRNGIAEDSEFTGVTTDAYGRYILSDTTSSGPIMAVGGVNTDTGVANTMVLQAPEGSMAINPITSLVQSLVLSQPGTTAAQASSQLATALGLSGLNLAQLDPLAMVGTQGLLAQKVAAQVATLVHLVAANGGQAGHAMTELANTLVSQTAPTGTTSLLSQPEVLQAWLSQSGLGNSPHTELLSAMQSSVSAIAAAPSLAAISQSQSHAMDTVAPDAPTIKMVLPTALGDLPQVVVALNTTSTNGTAAVAGDLLTVTIGDQSYTHTLTTADILHREATVAVAMSEQMMGATATLTDQAGHVSTMASASAPGSDTLQLATALGQPIQMMLQTLGNQELPMVGALDDFSQQIWLVIKDLLAKIPTAHVRTQAVGTALLTAAETTSEEQALLTFDTVTDTTDSTTTDDSGLPPWMTDVPTDDSSGGGTTPDSSTADDGVTPTPTTVDDSGTRVLVGRNSGVQFDLPNWGQIVESFWPSAFTMQVDTGEFSFHFDLPFRVAQWDMLGQLGIPGAQAVIDASFDSMATVTIHLEGQLDAKKYMVLDTEKSKIELSFNGGLQQGSQVAAELGPLVVAATDMNSARVDTDAERANTGLTASVAVYLKDNDDEANHNLTFNADTIAKYINEIADQSFKLSDWYDLKSSVQGQLSLQALARLDLQSLPIDTLKLQDLASAFALPTAVTNTAGAVDGFLTQIDSFLSMLSPQMSSKIYVPFEVSYDSTDTTSKWSSNYGQVYFDDVQIGAETVLTQTMEPGLDLLDNVMTPLYMVSDVFGASLFKVGSTPAFDSAALLTGWPTFVDTVVDMAVDQPINNALTTLTQAFDRDLNGDVTVFEALRGSVDVYQSMAEDVADLWTHFQKLPGAELALSAALGAGPTAVIKALLDAITYSVNPSPTTDNPNPQSPIEQIQAALDATEKVLSAIDQLQDLRGLYEAAVTELDNLSQVDGQTALTISLGSFIWNFEDQSFSQTRNAYAKKGAEYTSPSVLTSQQSLLTQKEAIQLIVGHIKAGTASSETLSPIAFERAGVDFSTFENFENAQFMGSKLTTGVTDKNLDALCNILNVQGSQLFTLDWLNDDSLYTPDASKLPTGTSFSLELMAIAYYDRLIQLAAGEGDLQGWSPSSMGATLAHIGVITASERVKVDGTGWDASGTWGYNRESEPYSWEYKYGGTAASYILYSIFEAQSQDSIDTWDELTEIWKVEKKIEDLMANQTVNGNIRTWEWDNPDDSTLDTHFLTFKDFATIGLPILSMEESVRKAANEAIRDWSDDDDWETPSQFSEVYEQAANIIKPANTRYLSTNGTSGDLSLQDTLSKIMAQAAVEDNGTGTPDQLSTADFKLLGFKTVTADEIPLLASLLASTPIQGEQVNSIEKIGQLVAAVDTLTATAKGETVAEADFFDAMELLLGTTTVGDFAKYSSLKYSVAEFLNHIPHANTGGIDFSSLDGRSLPLLQAIVKQATLSGADSYAELKKLAEITQDLLLTSMKDSDLWKVAVYSGNSTSAFLMDIGLTETVINSFKSYTSRLTVEDLNLLGYENVNATNLTAVVDALSQYNSTSSGTSAYTLASGYKVYAPNTRDLTYAELDKLVGDYSNSGFFTELLSKSPAFKTFWNAFRDAGFDLPFLSDPAVLQKLWLMEPLDLLTFTPDLSELSIDTGNMALFNLDLIKASGLDQIIGDFPLSSFIQASTAIKIEPHLGFGVDTGGLIEASQLPGNSNWVEVLHAMLNGLYINDAYYSNGRWQDLPELSVDIQTEALMNASLGGLNDFLGAFVELSSGLDFSATLDFANAGNDGKVRLGTLVSDLFTDPAQIFDLDTALNFYLTAQAGASLNFGATQDDDTALGNLLALVGKTLTWASGQKDDTFTWQSGELGLDIALIDSDPSTPAPSIDELVKSLTSAVIAV